MNVEDIKGKIPEKLYDSLKLMGFLEFRPSQEKSLKKGLLEYKSLLVCTPTASGKTLVAEIAAIKSILEGVGKAIYIVPLKALANEKYKQFQQRYGSYVKVAMSIGDLDSGDSYLSRYDLIIATSEKLDSLIRHRAPWLKDIKVVIVDEIHLMNDPGRGPTLEVLITLLRRLLKNLQIIALSATIGNPSELASWLKAELIVDHWRPTRLYKGVYLDGEVEFLE